MTKEKKKLYHDADELSHLLTQTLKGKKYKLHRGHVCTFGYFLGNDITIYNGKELKIICSQCGY